MLPGTGSDLEEQHQFDLFPLPSIHPQGFIYKVIALPVYINTRSIHTHTDHTYTLTVALRVRLMDLR